MKLGRSIPFLLSLLWAVAAFGAEPIALKGVAVGAPIEH